MIQPDCSCKSVAVWSAIGPHILHYHDFVDLGRFWRVKEICLSKAAPRARLLFGNDSISQGCFASVTAHVAPACTILQHSLFTNLEKHG
jgi:hypothetical protein